MELQQLQQIVQTFCQERDWDQFHDPKELAIGLSTEANELLSLFRFITKEDLNEVLNKKRSEVEDELMDVLFFILRFASLYEIDIPLAFQSKMKQNTIKYPVELVKGKNKKYNEY